MSARLRAATDAREREVASPCSPAAVSPGFLPRACRRPAGSPVRPPRKLLPHQLLPHKLLPHKLLPHKLLPHKLLPHKLLPHKLLPHKLLPHKLLPHKLGPRVTSASSF